MNRWLFFLLLLLPPALPEAPELDVQVAEGRVTLRAQGASLTDVLDQLSEKTGVNVVYQGPDPAPLVTAAFEDKSEREVLTSLLEGLGLNHVFQMDASGHHVEKLIVDEAYGSGPATAPARRQAIPVGDPDLGEVDEDVYEDPELDEAYPEEPPELAEGDPYGDAPDATWTAPPEAGWSDVEAPDFPVDASTPIPPGPVPYPLFPRPASYP